MHIAILMANTDVSAFARRHPDDGQKFTALLRRARPGWQASVFSVKDGVFPTAGARFDGWLITGSPASVLDRAPWMLRLETLVQDLHARGDRLFGACFGHQIVAQALGGRVGRNPGGWVLGRTQTTLAGAPVTLHAAHCEQVLDLPPGARLLGGNSDCAVGSYALGAHMLCTQYHPEMTTGFLAALVEELGDRLPPGVAARARATLAWPEPDMDQAADWICRFIETGETGWRVRTAAP